MDLKNNTHVKGPETRESPQRFEVLEAQVYNESSNPLGEVSGGYLRLRTVLRQVEFLQRVNRQVKPSDVDEPHGSRDWCGRGISKSFIKRVDALADAA